MSDAADDRSDRDPGQSPDQSPGTSPEQKLEIPVTDTQAVAPTGPTASLSALPTRPTLPSHYTLDDDTPVIDNPAAGGTTPPAAATAVAPDRARRSPRVRTVVFGLVMLAISVISIVALVTDVRVDGGIVGLGLLIGAGAALVAGGVTAAVREARGGPGAVR